MRLKPALIAGLCVACDGGDDSGAELEHSVGIQVGDEGTFGCSVSGAADVEDELAEIPELGMSASDAVAGLLGGFSGAGTLHDGSAVSAVSLTLSAAGSAQWVETVAPDGSASESCPPYLSVPVAVELDAGTVVMSSLGGQLAVSAQGTLLLAAADISAVSGSLEPLWVVPEDMAWTELRLLGSPDSGGGWFAAVGYMGCADGGACSPPVDASGADAELTVTVTP